MMNTNLSFMHLSILGVLSMLFLSDLKAQNRQIILSDIRSSKGRIIINVFKDAQAYDTEKPFKKWVFEKKGLQNGTLIVTCTLEAGTYAMTMVDDENNNGEIDKNFIGIPKEGFGFSNFFMTKMKKPIFDEFKVDLTSPGNRVEMKVKYM